MTKEQVIQGYLMNSPKVVAEMLYDTIEKYENRSCEGCKYAKLAKDSSMKEIPNNISTCYHDFKCKRYYTDKWESK